MVGMVQLVSAPDCGSGYRGFESHYPPFSFIFILACSVRYKSSMGYRQAVRHRTLTPAFAGSNPASPVYLGSRERKYGRVAQVVEHLTFNQVVRGSNPRTLTGFINWGRISLVVFLYRNSLLCRIMRIWRNWQTRQI